MSKSMSDHSNSTAALSSFENAYHNVIPDYAHNEGEDREYYRNYLLSFRQLKDMCIGEVFSEEERLAYCEALNEESARQYCRQIVDDLLSKQTYENHAFIPKVQDYLYALNSIAPQLDLNSRALLDLHIEMENQPISIEHLQHKAGIDSTIEVFLSYAQWARLLCDALTYLPPVQASGKDPYLSLALEEVDVSLESSSPCIKLNQDIFEALVQLYPA